MNIEALMQRLNVLEQRVDVLQKEIRQALGIVNKDFNSVFSKVTQALEVFDRRLSVFEENKIKENYDNRVPKDIEPADVPPARDGKEL